MSMIFGMVHLSDQFLILPSVSFVDYLVEVFPSLDTFRCLEILLMLTNVFVVLIDLLVSSLDTLFRITPRLRECSLDLENQHRLREFPPI